MKAIIKLLVAPVLAMVFATSAHAEGILLGSWGSNPGNDPGFGNSALWYEGLNGSMAADHTTYDLTSGLAPWAGPIPPSQWVSQAANSTVGGGVAPANGYYTFTSTFDATAGQYYGSFLSYADDTMQILLNGLLVVDFKNNNPNGPCAQGPGPGPTCVGEPFMAAWAGNLNATNVLTIIDWQSNGSAQGVDFTAELNPVPEPGSLLLLGTGLAGLAKFVVRKARATR